MYKFLTSYFSLETHLKSTDMRERERGGGSEELNILGFLSSLYLRLFWRVVENVRYRIQIFSMHMRGYCRLVPMHMKFYDAVRSADTDFANRKHLLFIFLLLFLMSYNKIIDKMTYISYFQKYI